MTTDFHDLMLAEIPRLRASATGLTGSPAEADDLVQEALLRAWRFRDGFQSGSNFSAWMFRILKNLFLTQLMERRSWVEDIDGQYSSQIQCAPNQEWRLRYVEVLAALARLPEDNRDALLLVVASGLSYQQAAEVAGCDVDVLRARIRRARVQLAGLTGIDPPPTSRSPDAPGLAALQ
jgi:RNA polymerase sigma-70 factor (ECF subfamily)